jgi:hypothetical protein
MDGTCLDPSQGDGPAFIALLKGAIVHSREAMQVVSSRY